MEAIYFGTCKIWGRGYGNGPWVMADLENGLWAGNVTPNPSNMPLTYPFVTAMVKGGANGFALKAADATQGKLQTMYDGPRPHGYRESHLCTLPTPPHTTFLLPSPFPPPAPAPAPVNTPELACVASRAHEEAGIHYSGNWWG